MNQLINQEHRKKMETLEAIIIGSGAMIDLEVNHYFSHGVYTRELFIPKDTIVTGRIHLNSTVNIITKGKIRAISDDGEYDIEAPFIFVSGSLVKKAVYAIEDTVWVNSFPWDGEEKDGQKLIEMLTVPTYKDLELMQ